MHRRLEDGTELYFLANLGEKPWSFTATFRAQASAVELWDAETVDITAAARLGENVLEVTVANKWSNRMIGDAQNAGPHPGTWKRFRDKQYLKDYPEGFARTGKSTDGYFAFATLRTFEQGDKLFPSGLLGPVTIRRFSAGGAPQP